MRIILIKIEKRRKQKQGVHDGEHKKKQQTTNSNKQGKNLGCNIKRRKKLNDRRTIREAPTPRPIKQSLLAQSL